MSADEAMDEHEQTPQHAESDGEREALARIPHALFHTDALPVDERFETWRARVLPLFESTIHEETRAEDFTARMESYDLRPMFLGLTSFEALRFRRGRRHAPAEDADHLLIQLYLKGGYVGHNGYRELRVRAGDICFLDLAKPLETSAQPSTNLALVVPRDVLADFAPRRGFPHAAVLPRESAVTQVLANHLLTVWKHLPGASRAEAQVIGDTLTGAVVGAFGLRAGAWEGGAADGARLEAICAYIEAHLDDPELGTEALCKRFACSRAQLYRLFQPLGGVASYIRRARLGAALRELSACRPGMRRVGDVAARWGFTSQSHFCRLFRQAYGISPSEASERACRDTRPMRPAGEAQALPAFSEWLRRLGRAPG